jgi:CO/xanthine dehydrogenase FAD-binding subunit
MQNFQFHTTTSLKEALELYSEYADCCKIIAGGTDLVPSLRNEEIHPGYVLNILEIDRLRGISEKENVVHIGPTTTFTDIANSEILHRYIPLLVQAASNVGGTQIRNRGTIGGNIITASPAADVLPAIIALDGELELMSKASGSRRLPAAKVVEVPYRTYLKPDEILTGITIRKPRNGTRCVFEKLGPRNAMARALISMSVVMTMEKDRVISDVRIVPGALMPVARRIHGAEKILEGKIPDEILIQSASEVFVNELEGVWSPEYKIPVARNLFKRIITSLLSMKYED